MTTPDNLAHDLAARNVNALQSFYSQYRSRIWAIAYRMTRDEWDAEEVVQDVLWTVYRKADSFRGESELWHWVRRVTQNAARMLLRKRRRVPTPMEDKDIESLFTSDPNADIATRTENLAGGRTAVAAIDHALSEQDPTNRTLFVMMDVHGLEKEEVADRLGLSVSAVKARLHRVRRALRDAAFEAEPTAMAA